MSKTLEILRQAREILKLVEDRAKVTRPEVPAVRHGRYSFISKEIPNV